MVQITIAFEVCSPSSFLFYELYGFVKSVEFSDILHQETATAVFHHSKERFDLPKCNLITRLAILEKIMKWIKWEDDLDAFIMWVYGPAGSGKSLIFSKFLANQVRVKSHIVTPLQPLIKAGFFNGPTSRRLVIIDCLNECPEPAQGSAKHTGSSSKRQATTSAPIDFFFCSLAVLKNTSPWHLALGYCLLVG